MTEREVQWEITRYMVALGADGPSFDLIVASGPTALCRTRYRESGVSSAAN